VTPRATLRGGEAGEGTVKMSFLPLPPRGEFGEEIGDRGADSCFRKRRNAASPGDHRGESANYADSEMELCSSLKKGHHWCLPGFYTSVRQRKGDFARDYPLNPHKNLNTRSRWRADARPTQWLLKKGDPIAILRLLIFSARISSLSPSIYREAKRSRPFYWRSRRVEPRQVGRYIHPVCTSRVSLV